jgi:hypothetical protein
MVVYVLTKFQVGDLKFSDLSGLATELFLGYR